MRQSVPESVERRARAHRPRRGISASACYFTDAACGIPGNPRSRCAALPCSSLLAAPLLGGCTLTFGLTGATIDNVSARRPTVAYTLDEPPPLDTPVESRDARRARLVRAVGAGWRARAPDRLGAWSCSSSRGGGRTELHEDQVVRIRSRPRARTLSGRCSSPASSSTASSCKRVYPRDHTCCAWGLRWWVTDATGTPIHTPVSLPDAPAPPSLTRPRPRFRRWCSAAARSSSRC